MTVAFTGHTLPWGVSGGSDSWSSVRMPVRATSGATMQTPLEHASVPQRRTKRAYRMRVDDAARSFGVTLEYTQRESTERHQKS